MMEITREKIKNDPLFYMQDLLKCNLWDKQKEIAEAVRDYSKVTVKSCHGSGKSYIAARIVLNFIHSYKESQAITTAPTFKQVRDILWKEINSAHSNAPFNVGGTMLDTRYTVNKDNFAVGLSTNDTNRFQGYHAPQILVGVDEASGVKQDIYDAIDGITSSGFTRTLLIGNPIDPTGYFAETFKSDQWHKITISCFDTPNFKNIKTIEELRESTEEQRKEVVMPFLISTQWAYERLQEWGEDSPLFQARVLGEFPTESDDTLIALRYAEQALRNEKASDGDIFIGLDPARFGSDRTAFYIRKGDNNIVTECFQKEDTMQTAGRAIHYLQKYPNSKMKIDSIGVGAGVVDRLKETEYADRVEGINVAEATEPDGEMKYINVRAKLYWRLRQKFMNSEIKILDVGTTVSDLTNLKYKFRSSDGAVQIESKEELKKRGLRSPDIADAMALSYAEDIVEMPTVTFI